MQHEQKKQWFLDRYCNQQYAALVEGDQLTEFFCEFEPRQSSLGNVYKGKIVNVLSGINAVFVHCGLDKNCYLPLDESYADYNKYDGTMGETNAKTPDYKVGDEVLVQVVKAPHGTKGAKVSANLSFVGKFIIYLPNTDFIGISRKITDEAVRKDLLSRAERMRETQNEGFIIRTKAPFATQEQLQTEAEYLKKLYADLLTSAKSAPVGKALYEEADLPLRVFRDSYGDDLSAIRVGDKALYERLLHLIRLNGDFPEEKLVFYTGERTMFREYGISPLIEALSQPIVPLKNGGSLVIDYTEAMTVVDVNTGSYVGKTSLEETAFAVNLEAAEEIARQVRLRNVGGIVTVDFIDMLDEAHREAVTKRLTDKLMEGNAKCNVLPMNELCVSLFTRKRVGTRLSGYLVKSCPHCKGAATVPDDSFVAVRLREEILERFAEGFESVIVDLNERLSKKIVEEGLFSIEAKTRWKDKGVYFIPHKTYREDSFSVRGEKTHPAFLPQNAFPITK